MAQKMDFSKFAKEFSKLGASKGGKARANTLTPEERSEIAKKAVEARWKKAGKLKPKIVKTPAPAKKDEPKKNELPFSLFTGTLEIGDMKIDCHVLNDHRRMLTRNSAISALGMAKKSGGDRLLNFITGERIKPFVSLKLREVIANPIKFTIPQGGIAHGLEADTLVDFCEAVLLANDSGVLQRQQIHIAQHCGILIRGFAKVGIIALIDEVTGFQEHRAKNALRVKLHAFIAEDMQEWAKRFPDEFWFELARLEGIRYSPRSRPLRWGKYIMMFVYDAIDKDVGKMLREKNPNPHYRKNHHQWLKKYGLDKVHDQITKVVTIMKLCADMDQFKKKFNRVFKKNDPQADWFDVWDI